MKALHGVIPSFLISVISLITLTSCSPSPGMLVGEWESTKPRATHLSIAQGASANDGYCDGFKYTLDGSVRTAFWLIRNESSGTVIYLSPGGALTNLYSGAMQGSARPYKVIELNSNTLIMKWTDAESGPLEIFEFHRVN